MGIMASIGIFRCSRAAHLVRRKYGHPAPSFCFGDITMKKIGVIALALLFFSSAASAAWITFETDPFRDGDPNSPAEVDVDIEVSSFSIVDITVIRLRDYLKSSFQTMPHGSIQKDSNPSSGAAVLAHKANAYLETVVKEPGSYQFVVCQNGSCRSATYKVYSLVGSVDISTYPPGQAHAAYADLEPLWGLDIPSAFPVAPTVMIGSYKFQGSLVMVGTAEKPEYRIDFSVPDTILQNLDVDKKYPIAILSGSEVKARWTGWID
jgi:hypothetical protein